MNLHPERWPEIHGVVALVLAVGVVAAVVILAVETVIHPGPITQAESTVLSTTMGAIIGAVATYLGVGRRREVDASPPPEDDKP